MKNLVGEVKEKEITYQLLYCQSRLNLRKINLETAEDDQNTLT